MASRGLLFWLGMSLMVGSFALYPAYGLIALLPISVAAKAECAAAGWAVSWTLFFAGSALAGKEGVDRVRGRIAKHRWRGSDVAATTPQETEPSRKESP